VVFSAPSNSFVLPYGKSFERMPLHVIQAQQPPERLEGGGFTIRDIMNGIPFQNLDPFLMWHEIPRAFHFPGSFPGAPRHPHRGFMECPYFREMTADTGVASMESTVWAGGKHRTIQAEPGSFELGRIGIGMEHDGLIDKKWSGYIHMFQLWVNLPSANKFDPPHFQNVMPSAVPHLELECGRVSVLHGEFQGTKSPSECDVVQWQYLDLELLPNAMIHHDIPSSMSTRLIYVYRGELSVSGTVIPSSTVACLEGDDLFEARAGNDGAGLLFIAGAPIGEVPVQHGPFVMSSREQIVQAFHEFQRGDLAPKEAKMVVYK